MMLLMLLIARLLPDFNLWLAPEEVGGDNRVWVIRGILPIIIRLLLMSENSLFEAEPPAGLFC